MNWTQTPGEKRNYRQNIQGDVVVSAQWSITPPGPLLDTPQNTETSTTVPVSGLTDGVDYELTVLIQTIGGQTLEGCTYIQCRDC